MDHGHGTVVCLKLKDFMQFSNMVEFRPGPMLNVVVGPNGSGKSSLVNGIALALGSKTNVLGRAQDIGEFIRYGANQAELEIELLNALDPDKNYKINRKIIRKQMDEEEDEDDEGISVNAGGVTGVEKTKKQKQGPGRDTAISEWKLNGSRSNQKQVVNFVRQLNIQTDNLCQFLPQDKVHEFSKLNAKDLLVKTVEAVGDVELRNDHEKLKELQNSKSNSEIDRAKKQDLLKGLLVTRDQLGLEVKELERQKNLEARLNLLHLRTQWVRVEECKAIDKEENEKWIEFKKSVQETETKIAPKIKKLNDISKKKHKFESQVNDLKVKKRQLVSVAGKITKRKEEIPDAIEGLNGEYFELVQNEKNREQKLKKLNEELQKLTDDYKNADNQGEVQRLEKECQRVQVEMQATNKDKSEMEGRLRDLNYERKALENEISMSRNELEQVRSVQKQKMETMERGLPNGKDAVKAMRWLQDNRAQFSGTVYDPIMMGIDVHDAPANAKYLENAIAARDLVAFAAENAEDVNQLTRQFRDVMNLRVNIIQVDPNLDPERMHPRSENPNAPDFKGYLKDMFTCPPAIKAYLCKMYQLHNIPVFGIKADANLGNLVEEFNVFFSGDTRHSVIKSSYSGQKSTTSSAIQNRHWLQISLDKNRIKKLETKLVNAQNGHEKITNDMDEMVKEKRNIEQELESQMREFKGLKNKIELKKVLKGRIEVKKNEIAIFQRDNKPRDLTKDRENLDKKKSKLIAEDVKLATQLTENLLEARQIRQNMDLLKTAEGVVEMTETRLKNELSEDKEELNKLKESLGEQEAISREAHTVYINAVHSAQKLTGGNYKGNVPPQQIVDQWAAQGIDEMDFYEASSEIETTEMQLQNCEEIPQHKIAAFKDAVENVNHTEKQLANYSLDIENNRRIIDEIKARWLEKLEGLVGNISERFSAYFEHMEYAGEIRLNKGNNNEDDFTNYGLEVMVKFRDKYDLQRLDPFKQSGGERSVSTALYMMAMQHMTQVPFRCVDEINQGMDECNERKVFDLLIETAVNTESPSQYFLLTPKLLNDLHFVRGVEIHNVHNGIDMSHGPDVLMKNFRKVAADRKRNSEM